MQFLQILWLWSYCPRTYQAGICLASLAFKQNHTTAKQIQEVAREKAKLGSLLLPADVELIHMSPLQGIGDSYVLEVAGGKGCCRKLC